MAGLHNKYPDYFYKPGNLFAPYLQGANTALGQSSHLPERAEDEADQSDDAPSQELLFRFLRANLSPEQQQEFAESVARHKGIALKSPARWGPLHARAFVHGLVSPEEAELYLTALRQRDATGRALIQPRGASARAGTDHSRRV